MASFQQDYREGKIKEMIEKWGSAAARSRMIDAKRYYKGDNVTIAAVQKYYWSDKYKKKMPDPYVANHHIGFNKFHDVVAQKVLTLLNEEPTIPQLTDQKVLSNLGYALKRAGTECSICGRAFVFVGESGSLTVFASENCIPYYDDKDKDIIMAFIRFWDAPSLSSSELVRYAEVYDQDGMTLWKGIGGADFKVETSKTPYKYKTLTDFEGERTEAQKISRIPIVEMDNDEDGSSDMTPDLRSKIDTIDLINSGFMNNIDDFSELYWVVKNGTGLSSDELEDFVASIQRTRKVLLNGDSVSNLDVDTKQINIPTEARKSLTDELKSEIADETGVVDPKDLTGSSVTNVAIKAVTMKLRQRVADFEWFVYKATLDILSLLDEYSGGGKKEYDVTFTELLVDNETEIIENANSIQPHISRHSYLVLLKKANAIESVESEEKALDEESVDKYSVDDGSDAGDGAVPPNPNEGNQ